MKTLKEYSNFLHANGYEESIAPYTFLDGNLEIVEFTKNNFIINLYVKETEEFSKYLDSLEPGVKYEIDYNNYEVVTAFLESPICNVSDFLDGTTNGITLVSEANPYNYHTLDLFELCIGFQKIDLLEHELFIMSKRIELLSWAKANLIPILEKYDYKITYNTFFDTNSDSRTSSNIRLDFTHANGENIVIETDCLTGKPLIWTTDLLGFNSVNLADKIYGKSLDEVYNTLLEEIWKKDESKYGYIYNNDPHETVDTYHEVLTLMQALDHKRKDAKINFNVIPKRYEYLLEEYEKLKLLL